MCIDVDVSASHFHFVFVAWKAQMAEHEFLFSVFFFFQANVFLVQSNGLFASLKWFFFYFSFVFRSASHSIIAFRLRSYLELDYIFGFIWTFVFSIFNQRFTCHPFLFFSGLFFFPFRRFYLLHDDAFGSTKWKFIAFRQMIDSGS